MPDVIATSRLIAFSTLRFRIKENHLIISLLAEPIHGKWGITASRPGLCSYNDIQNCFTIGIRKKVIIFLTNNIRHCLIKNLFFRGSENSTSFSKCNIQRRKKSIYSLEKYLFNIFPTHAFSLNLQGDIFWNEINSYWEKYIFSKLQVYTWVRSHFPFTWSGGIILNQMLGILRGMFARCVVPNNCSAHLTHLYIYHSSVHWILLSFCLVILLKIFEQI